MIARKRNSLDLLPPSLDLDPFPAQIVGIPVVTLKYYVESHLAQETISQIIKIAAMYLSYVCDTSRCGPFRVNADENNNAYYTVLRFDANARARECQNGCRYDRDKMLVVVGRKIMVRGCRGLRFWFIVLVSKRNPNDDRKGLICGVSGHS